jgi:hypothetical protein
VEVTFVGKSKGQLVAEFWDHLHDYVNQPHVDKRLHLVKPGGNVCKTHRRDKVCIEVKLRENARLGPHADAEVLCLDDPSKSQFEKLEPYADEIKKDLKLGESVVCEKYGEYGDKINQSALLIRRKYIWENLEDKAYRQNLIEWFFSKMKQLLEIWEKALR